MVVGDFTVEHGTLRPWDTSVGNENVETTVELLGNLIDCFLDANGICDVYLVGLACSQIQSVHEQRRRHHEPSGQLTLDAIVLLNSLSALNGFLIAVVPDGDVGPRLSQSLSNGETDTGASTRDDGRLALVGEEGQNPLAARSDGVVVAEVACLGLSFHGNGRLRSDLELVEELTAEDFD